MPYKTLKGKRIRFHVVSEGMNYGTNDETVYDETDISFIKNDPLIELYDCEKPRCDGHTPLTTYHLETLLSEKGRASNLLITPCDILSQKENEKMAIALEIVKRMLELGE